MKKYEEFTLFDMIMPHYKIDPNKKLRLITMFSGYDSQALALKYLGVDFEHYRTCEWAVKSIQALKDLHFANDIKDYSKEYNLDYIYNYLYNKGISQNYNEPMKLEQIKRLGEERARTIYNNIQATKNMVNIQQVKAEDLAIVEKDKYEYLFTYSFPCQDLSLAGLRKGMKKGESTRSGMLWEIERLLNELCGYEEPRHTGKNTKILDDGKIYNPISKIDKSKLPQILFMENVPEVIGKNNIKDFQEWVVKLESLGYSNYVECLNSKDYGIPQNRNRCFMISILGEYTYKFPQPFELKLRLKDLLESNVDEKYYLSDSKIKSISEWKAQQDPLKDIDKEKEICPTLTARGAGEEHSGMILINEDVYNQEIPLKRGYSVNVEKESEDTTEIDVLGNYSKSEYNATQIVVKNGISPTIRENHGEVTAIVESDTPNLKTQLCNSLIENGLVKENDVIRHSYSTCRMEQWKERNVEFNNMSPTLDTRCDCLGVVVKEDLQPKLVGGVGEKKSNNGTQYYQQDRIYDSNAVAMCHPAGLPSGSYMYQVEENKLISIESLLLAIFDLCSIINKKENGKYERSRNLLQILWREITKEEIWDEIRRFYCVQKEKILQPNVYENGIHENRLSQSRVSDSPCDSKTYNGSNAIREKMFDMWENWKDRYTSQRYELSEQQFRQFNLFMSELSHETTSKKECMQDLWQTNEGFRILQQTLFKIQEIWRSNDNKICSTLRIRKLSPRETFRLMGVKDEDFDKIKNNQSDSSLWHLAGDSIVVDVMYYMFKQLL